MVVDSFPPQGAMDPEAVEAGLLDDDERKIAPGARPYLPSERLEAIEKAGQIAAVDHVLGHLLTPAWRQRCHQPFCP
jgi:hypothetical protein